MPKKKGDILGQCMGVRIQHRVGSAPLLTLLVEDDGMWYESDFTLGVHWVPDLITVLSRAKREVTGKR